MTKVIILSGGNLDSYKEQIDDYLFAKYHSYPTSLEGGYSNKTGFYGGAGPIENCSGRQKKETPNGKRIV